FELGLAIDSRWQLGDAQPGNEAIDAVSFGIGEFFAAQKLADGAQWILHGAIDGDDILVCCHVAGGHCRCWQGGTAVAGGVRTRFVARLLPCNHWRPARLNTPGNSLLLHFKSLTQTTKPLAEIR